MSFYEIPVFIGVRMGDWWIFGLWQKEILSFLRQILRYFCSSSRCTTSQCLHIREVYIRVMASDGFLSPAGGRHYTITGSDYIYRYDENQQDSPRGVRAANIQRHLICPPTSSPWKEKSSVVTIVTDPLKNKSTSTWSHKFTNHPFVV